VADLSTSIEYLKGVGPTKADLLRKEFGISRFADLLKLYPYRYVDRWQFYTVSQIASAEAEVQLKGKITNLHEVEGKSRSKRLVAHFENTTGSVELVWFKGAPLVKKF
jgi:ATP-dependent DNA helicase RecG